MTMEPVKNRKTMRIINAVVILNPWDSQGVQIADGTGIYPCVRGCGGGGYQQGYVLQHLKHDLRAEGENRPSRPEHIVILNDQGGSVMNINHDVISTLRAESHQHEPVICFEPGIAKREGSDSRFVEDMCGTLRADMGDNQPAVCFSKDKLVYVFKERAGCPGGGKGILVAENKAFTLATNFNGAICYAVDSHPMDSRFGIEGDVSPTVTAKLAKGAADGPLVLIDHG